ncbi:MAG TPA: trypsin-like serine protease [Actinomycetota bacterium]|nr:trypsin-like serine protease [Actinomycetota bacterium]
MRRVLVLAAASAALTVAVPAVAITEAELDGNGHASVGALIGHPPGGGLDIACSGFLVRPRVLVTAGHCTYGLAKEPEAPFVTFDPVFDPDTANLFPAKKLVTHPAFDPITLKNDVGIVTLEERVRGVDPIDLPTADLLGEMRRSKTLPDTLTMVSYGVFVDCSVHPCAFVFDGARRVASAGMGVVQKDFFFVRNGVCSHDSGSPLLLPGTGTSVGVTTAAFGCAKTGGAQRLDTPAARSFLDDFVTLP